MVPFDTMIDDFRQALLAVDRLKAHRILQDAFQQSGNLAVVDGLLTPALEQIGEQWERGQAALSQVYMSGVICEEFVSELASRPPDAEAQNTPVAMVTFEDYHALGKRIVLAMLRARGVPVIDFGAGVQVAPLVRLVQEHHIRILLISTLMLPSALHIVRVREALEQAGNRAHLIVGGAPFRFDEHLWQRVRADAMGRTAADALHLTTQAIETLQLNI